MVPGWVHVLSFADCHVLFISRYLESLFLVSFYSNSYLGSRLLTGTKISGKSDRRTIFSYIFAVVILSFLIHLSFGFKELRGLGLIED